MAGKAPPSNEALQRRKLALLNLTAAAAIPARHVTLHYLAAAADTALAAVASRGEELLRKRVAHDSSKPCIDLEDTSLLSDIFDLFLGSTAAGVSPEAARTPASPALRARLLSLLVRSRAAANGGARALAVLAAAVAAPGAPAKLRAAGMEFAVWTLKHATEDVLTPMVSSFL